MASRRRFKMPTINRALWRAIYEKMKLVGETVNFKLRGTIQPTYEVNEVFKRYRHIVANAIDSTSTGYKLLYTVPDGKRMILKLIYYTRTGDVAEINKIAMEKFWQTTPRVLDTFTAGSSAVLNSTEHFPNDVIMDAGDKLYVYVSTLDADDTWSGHIGVVEEELARGNEGVWM